MNDPFVGGGNANPREVSARSEPHLPGEAHHIRMEPIGIFYMQSLPILPPQKKGGLAGRPRKIQIGFRAYCQ
jgi:hypothetical protein